MFRAWTLPALMAVLLASTGASAVLHAQTVDSPNKASADGKAAKRADPAEAKSALDGVAKALDAGKTEQAVQQINGLLSGSRLQGPSMARALYLRGAAYQKQGKPAQAIADLTSALWLKGGLSEADRAAATALRTEAYRQAGLNDLAEADAKKAGGRSGASASAPAAASSGWQTESARRVEPEQKTTSALTAKILDRPRLVDRIFEAISDPESAHLTCFNATELERTLRCASASRCTPAIRPSPISAPRAAPASCCATSA